MGGAKKNISQCQFFWLMAVVHKCIQVIKLSADRARAHALSGSSDVVVVRQSVNFWPVLDVVDRVHLTW